MWIDLEQEKRVLYAVYNHLGQCSQYVITPHIYTIMLIGLSLDYG